MKTLINYLTDQELIEGMRRTAGQVQQYDWLEALSEQLAMLLFEEQGMTCFWEQYEQHRAEIKAILQDDSECYLAYVYDKASPRLIAYYQSKGIPEQIMKATLADIDLRAYNYHMMHNHAGIDDYKWLTRHITGIIFQLGRLQYVYDKTFDYKTYIFKHRYDGTLVKLAEHGLFVDGGGFYSKQETAVFTTMLERNNTSITGNKIDELGNILCERFTVSLDEYECVVEPGEAVIDIHIPATGKMGYEECTESMKEALEFARKYFPDIDYKGFVCSSWLLSDELIEKLPASANIVRFSGLFTRCAAGRSDHELIYKWIFGMDKNKEDYQSHEAVTTLQKGTRELMEQGRWYQSRAGFISTEEIQSM